ncbi:CHAT domain-containing protein [Adhaeribacter radiodurans]|uniref:Tetratricopeptide repeat protein n=1 Tax=Adhaeribacter radiodurans TaxID=2745197 RepID=A0A7L7LDD6_9BACT|nr:CHAT domain-containing protein [Adhaeribacter radiodurans]QMU30545.1 tetratricopeptide repeat protein [Adhaeribacter radiodurans]
MKASLVIAVALAFFSIRFVQAQNKPIKYDPALARKWYNQALNLQEKGDYNSSILLFEKASALYKKHSQWTKQIDCDNEFSHTLFMMGRYNEALQTANQTLQESLEKFKGDSTKIVKSYINLGNVLQVKGEFEKALAYQVTALRIRRSIFGDTHPDVANSYDQIGTIYFDKGEYDKSLGFHLKSLQIKRILFTETNPNIANSYHYIGGIYLLKSEIDKALEYFNKAVQIRRAAFGEIHKDVAFTYNNIGNTYHQKSEYGTALEYHQKALYIRRLVFGEMHPNVADSYNNIGNVLQVKGEFNKALEYHQKALYIRRTALGENHADVAQSYNYMGIIYQAKGEFDKSLEYHHTALNIRRSALGESSAGVADSYNQLGNVYYDKGEYEKALEYYQKSLYIRRAVFGETHQGVANSYQNMGRMYFIKGEYDQALEFHQQSLHIRRKVFGEKHPNVAFAYNNIGNTYLEKGEYDKALEYHQKALQIRQAVLGETHLRVANSYNDIGNVLAVKGEYDNALEYYQKSLDIRHRALNEIHPDVAESYNKIGMVYQSKREYEKASHYHQKALQSYRGAFGKTHPSVADAYYQLGNVNFHEGAYTQALQQYQQAITAIVPSFSDTTITFNPVFKSQTNSFLVSKTLLTSLQAKAKVLEVQFNQSHNLPDLLLAYQTSCSADSLAHRTQQNFERESDKVAFTSSSVVLYQQALALCLKLYRFTKNKNYLNKAFYFAERGKASVLMTSLAESKAKTFAGIPDSLLKQDQVIRTQIAQYSQRLAGERTKTNEGDSSKLQNYESQLFSIRRQQESLIQQFEEFYPQYYALKYQSATVTPNQLQSQLDTKTALLEYVVSDTLLQVFIVGRDFFKVESVPLDSLFRRRLTAFREGILLQDQDLYEQVAYSLFKILIPSNLPKSINSLIIIPAGELTSLPFEALLTKPADGNLSKPAAYLLSKYTISYAYSAWLLYQRFTQEKATPIKNLLAMAPVFVDSLNDGNDSTILPNTSLQKSSLESTSGTITDNRGILSNTTEQPFSKSNSRKHGVSSKAINSKSLGSRSFRNQEIPPLIASEQEVKTIAHLFQSKGARAKVYLHHQASEEQIKNEEVSGYNYIHLATHGFANEKYPELSGLLFSQGSSNQEDGTLYTGEIYNMRLKAELVTLSACETGLGKLVRGEGVIGLTRALLYAGAKNVVVSLWNVNDGSTAVLMENFYKALLAGYDKAQALQIAKQKLIQQSRYNQPFYWAPFVLIGK